MKKTWRWFGVSDNITLQMLSQIGVEGIVTSLHYIPNGHIWPLEEIVKLKTIIENAKLEWSVVESLPVCEEIKFGGVNRDRFIENYIESLRNLGKAGIKNICYNFMPVIDWVRTDLNYMLPDGAYTLFFDKIKFAYFDIYILKREQSKSNYTHNELLEVEKLGESITEDEIENLIDTIIVKTQGFINGNIKENDKNPIEIFKQLISKYTSIDKNQLRENLKYFLEKIMPICEEYNINMAIHPDDPPYPVLGLPRIVSSEEDLEWIFKTVDHRANGLTFCSGSLCSGLHNDTITLCRKFISKIRFVHLRSTSVFENGNFIEANHLEGRAHLVELVRLLEKENPFLPMRIDHGKLMLSDVRDTFNPGYSFLGRMYALAQIDGVIAVINNELQIN